MVRIDITALLCICLPLILGAPVDEIVRQQLTSGLYREDSPYWSLLNPARDSAGNRIPPRRFDSLGGDVIGTHKRFDSLSGATFGNQKRNFDEIDRAGFGSFVKKNFDEIDRNGFGFNKRNFDEIDRTGFGAFVKRGV